MPYLPGTPAACLFLAMLLAGCRAVSFEPSVWTPPQPEALERPETEIIPLDWRDWPPMSEPVVGHAVTPTAEHLVVVGGVTALGQMSAAIQLFEGNAWTGSELQLDTPRAFHAQIRLDDGRILIAGGQTGTALEPTATASIEIIDLKAATVIPGPDLPEPTASPTAHALSDGRIAIVTDHAVSLFDPGDALTLRSFELLTRHRNHAAAVLNDDRIVIVGGRSADIEIFDPATETVTLAESRLPFALDDHRIIDLPNGSVWILGGQNTRTGETVDLTWVFHPQRGGWLSPGPSLDYSTGIADACLVRSGNRAWLLGGESQRSGRDVELSIVRQLDLQRLTVDQQAATRFDHDDASAALWRGRIVILSGLSYTEVLGRKLPYPNGQVEYAVLDR